MRIFLALLTYFAYIFIVVAYGRKIVKYLSLPTHLRWELYPVMHEERYSYGGSYFEHVDWVTKARKRNLLRSIIYLLKEYLVLGEYFSRHKSYWLALYPWHIGFILIITFHILCFVGAVAMVLGTPVSPTSTTWIGLTLYYLILLTGVISFITGLVGSIGMIIKRTIDYDLRSYASPQNFLTYLFCLVVFASGLYAWYFVDPTFDEYREFWKGLVTLTWIDVAPAAAAHILIFDLFLIYLPFTRSMHYITRIFAFFLIRWDDEPNFRGSRLETKLLKLLSQEITWSAPHLKGHKTWKEAATAIDGKQDSTP